MCICCRRQVAVVRNGESDVFWPACDGCFASRWVVSALFLEAALGVCSAMQGFEKKN